jgi:Phage integrase, N-terminal SAM-like domain
MVEPPKKLLEQLRDTLRVKHYSYRTEQTYVDWTHRYVHRLCQGKGGNSRITMLPASMVKNILTVKNCSVTKT